MARPRALRVYQLGRVEYHDGMGLMARAAAALGSPDAEPADYLFLLEHPPVLTFGRAAEQANLLASPEWLERNGFEVHQTDRGGEVTYHGPGQVVGYPVVDLSDRRDVRRWVADLEEAMVQTCADYGLTAGRHPEHRGAWIGLRKIGAVGVHLSRWISTHGFAFNLAPDLRHFQAIVPCGIADPGLGVTSLAAELTALGRPVPAQGEVQDRLATHLALRLGRERVDQQPSLRTISVVPVAADGRVLLLRRSEARGGFWQPVTGRIEPGESPAQAAQRELEEETGAASPVISLGYQHQFGVDPELLRPVRPGLHVADETAFGARLAEPFEVRLSAEHAAFGWFPLADALDRLPFAGLRRAVRLAVATLAH
jgi:lipoyl(octanoyl) transferase